MQSIEVHRDDQFHDVVYRACHHERLAVRPGLWQVWTQRHRLDVPYARNCRLSTDLRVFPLTPPAMIRDAA